MLLWATFIGFVPDCPSSFHKLLFAIQLNVLLESIVKLWDSNKINKNYVILTLATHAIFERELVESEAAKLQYISQHLSQHSIFKDFG